MEVKTVLMSVLISPSTILPCDATLQRILAAACTPPFPAKPCRSIINIKGNDILRNRGPCLCFVRLSNCLHDL